MASSNTTITTAQNTQNTQSTQPQRPSAFRQSSTSSQLSQASQSLSEASSSHSNHTHKHHKPQRHVVGGHGRLGARNSSTGKNLNKLAKHVERAGGIMPNDGSNYATSSGKNHSRNRSGDSNSEANTASSPRPHVKRNASAFVIARNVSHTALKKNFSSGHLPRNQTTKNMNKPRAQPPQAKRTRSGRGDRSEPASPAQPAHPTVRFALGDEVEEPEQDDNEWTEGSASASPHLTRDNTRDNTRQNSVILDPEAAPKAGGYHSGHDTSEAESTNTVVHAPVSSAKAQATEATIDETSRETPFTYQHMKPPDADVITSRLLQRTSQHPTANPQVSTVSATVTASSHNNRTLNHSTNSTLAEGTPGRDLVSRFVNANSADGTPRDGDLLPHKSKVSLSREVGEMDKSKRNKSAPNFADSSLSSPTLANNTRRSLTRSGTSTPTELPPSRTQQKLLLQRASSVIEPQKHLPAILPSRPGAPQLLSHGIPFPLPFGQGEAGVAAHMSTVYAQISKEYNVVRRYRSPIADAVGRQKQIVRPERRSQARTRRTADENGVSFDESPVGSFKSRDLDGANHYVSDRRHQHHDDPHHAHQNGSRQARPQPQHHASQHPQDRTNYSQQHQITRSLKEEARGQGGHKSRVSFDLPNSLPDDDDTDEEVSLKAESERTRASLGERGEAYEICRRLWEMPEVVVAGGGHGGSGPG